MYIIKTVVVSLLALSTSIAGQSTTTASSVPLPTNLPADTPPACIDAYIALYNFMSICPLTGPTHSCVCENGGFPIMDTFFATCPDTIPLDAFSVNVVQSFADAKASMELVKSMCVGGTFIGPGFGTERATPSTSSVANLSLTTSVAGALTKTTAAKPATTTPAAPSPAVTTKSSSLKLNTSFVALIIAAGFAFLA